MSPNLRLIGLSSRKFMIIERQGYQTSRSYQGLKPSTDVISVFNVKIANFVCGETRMRNSCILHRTVSNTWLWRKYILELSYKCLLTWQYKIPFNSRNFKLTFQIPIGLSLFVFALTNISTGIDLNILLGKNETILISINNNYDQLNY